MTGAGPSRRSHTKSRTGCKTCKRRHIRCDETVPQCRNCTKHQVRCDYMDDSPADSTVPSPRSSSDFTNRSIDADLAAWRQSGAFPFPALLVERPPSPDTLSDTELRLIHHLCSVCNDLRQAGTSSLTIWTERIPKFLSLASGHSFLMQALCSFSATHLAWKESSAEFRNLQTEHGGIALRGLHDAIGAFSQENADAIVAASMLMNWQATDWLSWSSLSAGSYTVMGAMTPWARSQFLAEHFPREGLTTATFRPPTSVKVISVAERAQILGNVVEALQAVRLGLRGQDMEAYWMDQLLAYVERLQHTNPAQSPEEQFEHAYILRKWAFWVPISMLQRQDAPQGQVTIVLAHLYATIVALEPVFPNLLSLFQTVMIMPPLETIIDLTEAMSRHQDGSASAEISAVMHFARQTAYEHRFIRSRQNSGMSSQGDGSEQNLSVSDFSPAFVPSTPAELQVQSEITRHLNVPISNTGFTYGVSTWGMAPSPGFPPQDFGVDFLGTSSPDMLDSQSGFVNTIPIWV